MPGLGHRQAAVPQAGHPRPARPRLRQGPLPSGRLDEARDKLPDAVKKEAERPLVGTAEDGGVIDPDVLWSCTNCGACVEECPVDIEHIDHIDGMRRHQVLIESAFPVEAAGMLRNLENKGDPWGMGGSKRAGWITELDFEVPVVDGKIGDGIEYLFWVGCAGALEDRAKKTTKAIATLLHQAGVTFAVLGPAETCTGDPARRVGNEFVFSVLAQQNIETLNEAAQAKDSLEVIDVAQLLVRSVALRDARQRRYFSPVTRRGRHGDDPLPRGVGDGSYRISRTPPPG